MTLLLQCIIIILVAPLIQGSVTKLKNFFRMRTGAPVLQPYYNLCKLFAKGEVVSVHASWIFRVAPFVMFASTLTAACCIPLFHTQTTPILGDVIAFVFILALGRLFLTLAALDTGSAFGGIGSSREMFISSLVEPVAGVALIAVGLVYGTTNLYAMHTPSTWVPLIAAATALFMTTLAETARLPIDNQETHLELTMIHEAMLLEYSGRSLAYLELSAYIKQCVWFLLIAHIIFPTPLSFEHGLGGLLVSAVMMLGKVMCIGLCIACVEVCIAKLRLFRVVDFLGFASVFAMIAIIGVAL